MRRVLIIDDDALVRDSLATALKRLGFAVEVAANGLIGLQLFHSSKPDVVITDIVMPEVDGISFLLKVRQENPRIPLIVMSGDPTYSEVYLKAARQMEATKVLKKPLKPEELIQAITEVCGG